MQIWGEGSSLITFVAALVLEYDLWLWLLLLKAEKQKAAGEIKYFHFSVFQLALAGKCYSLLFCQSVGECCTGEVCSMV